MRTMILIINLVCLAFMIFNMVNIAKTDKEMDKMFKKLDEDFIKKMKALTLHLTLDEALELIQLLNKRIVEAGSCMIMINEPKLKGANKNIVFKNNKLVFAEIRVKGTYFDDREAITFNEDGFIGLCGWADGYNLTPFVMGFKDWCDYMKNKVGDDFE